MPPAHAPTWDTLPCELHTRIAQHLDARSTLRLACTSRNGRAALPLKCVTVSAESDADTLDDTLDVSDVSDPPGKTTVVRLVGKPGGSFSKLLVKAADKVSHVS